MDNAYTFLKILNIHIFESLVMTYIFLEAPTENEVYIHFLVILSLGIQCLRISQDNLHRNAPP